MVHVRYVRNEVMIKIEKIFNLSSLPNDAERQNASEDDNFKEKYNQENNNLYFLAN